MVPIPALYLVGNPLRVPPFECCDDLVGEKCCWLKPVQRDSPSVRGVSQAGDLTVDLRPFSRRQLVFRLEIVKRLKQKSGRIGVVARKPGAPPVGRDDALTKLASLRGPWLLEQLTAGAQKRHARRGA
jgi:hypothetical protein